MKRRAMTAFLLSAAMFAGGCKDDHKADDGHKHDGKGAAAPASNPSGQKPGGDHPNQLTLGETTSNGLKFKAAQDEPIKAGGEGAFDLVITGYPAGAKPKAVRFWVGT